MDRVLDARSADEGAAKEIGDRIFLDTAVIGVSDIGRITVCSLEFPSVDVGFHLSALPGDIQRIEGTGDTMRRAGNGLKMSVVNLGIAC